MASLQPLDNLAEVRERLARHLPFSPLDYVPELSRKGDRDVWAEQLTAPRAEVDDLRRCAKLADGTPLAMFLERLPWDSEFFGYGVAKLSAVFPLEAPLLRLEADYRPALTALLEEAKAHGIRYLFATVDPRDLALLRALGDLQFALIETRYYQHGAVVAPAQVEPLPVRRAVPDDIPSLARTARDTVNRYDRFHADPFIERGAVEQLMQRWVEQSIAGAMADLVLVPDVDRPTAFVTYQLLRANWSRWKLNLVRGVLSAATPDMAGWLGKLGPVANRLLADQGAQYSYGSTQVTNRPIVWFAQEAGARFGRCEHVFRRLL